MFCVVQARNLLDETEEIQVSVQFSALQNHAFGDIRTLHSTNEGGLFFFYFF
jgi:hypothetical protein